MKGVTILTSTNLVAVILTAALLALTVNFYQSIEQSSRVETLPVVEKRTESVVYMMSGVEDGSTTIKLDAEYGLEKSSGKVLINYSADILAKPNDGSQRELNPPVDFVLTEEGVTTRICVRKSASGISVSPEAC